MNRLRSTLGDIMSDPDRLAAFTIGTAVAWAAGAGVGTAFGVTEWSWATLGPVAAKHAVPVVLAYLGGELRGYVRARRQAVDVREQVAEAVLKLSDNDARLDRLERQQMEMADVARQVPEILERLQAIGIELHQTRNEQAAIRGLLGD